MKHTRPEDLFRAEKERAVSARNSQHARLLAEAKAAFDKLMAEGQAARKSGRPRKHPLPPLKTSSSRMPPRPPAPLIVAAKPEPAAAAPIAAPVRPKPATARPVSGRKTAKAARKARPAATRAKSSRKSTKGKPKSKHKGSGRR